jgi:uncharacterized protein YyaL (SSP411 family)
MKNADVENGGFGRAPKFPQTFSIAYLLGFGYFLKDEASTNHALKSLDALLNGGIYDHLNGGLARYSTDDKWLAPHFEKMLYDNALLIDVLCDAYKITKNKRYQIAIEKTINFCLNELSDPKGGFYAAIDADSEGEEGKFYVWSQSEIEAILGQDAALVCNYYGVLKEGNWEGKNILHINKSSEIFADENGLALETWNDILENSNQKLLIERKKRIHPAIDDKIILSWNALMLKAITKASASTPAPKPAASVCPSSTQSASCASFKSPARMTGAATDRHPKPVTIRSMALRAPVPSLPPRMKSP